MNNFTSKLLGMSVFKTDNVDSMFDNDEEKLKAMDIYDPFKWT